MEGAIYTRNDGDIILDRFEIKRALGSGGMGEVYEALDTKLERTVALKTIKNDTFENNPKYIERFKAECLLTAKLEHPNIIRVYDFIEDDGTFYLVMEHLKGKSLKEKIERGRLSRAEAKIIYEKSLEALNYLHSNNPVVLHRDISPHNIFITDDNKVKLIDFGISKVIDDGDKETSTHYYKMTYSCPELWENGRYVGENYQARHDLYSLALVKYEMLTGRKVFKELEVTQGFPKELVESGVQELDEFIRSGNGSLKKITYEQNTVSAPFRGKLEEKPKPKFNPIISIAVLLVLFVSIISYYLVLGKSDDSEIVIVKDGSKLRSKKMDTDPLLLPDLSLDACLLACYQLMIYPGVYMDGNYKIHEIGRNMIEKWEYYEGLRKKSSCMQRVPYCQLAFTSSNSFKEYLLLPERKKSFDDFSKYLHDSLGEEFKGKDVYKDYLLWPAQYSTFKLDFVEIQKMYKTKLPQLKEPFENLNFIYMPGATLAKKYHLLKLRAKDRVLDDEYCKVYGDMAFVADLNHKFLTWEPFELGDFSIIICKNFDLIGHSDKNSKFISYI